MGDMGDMGDKRTCSCIVPLPNPGHGRNLCSSPVCGHTVIYQVASSKVLYLNLESPPARGFLPGNKRGLSSCVPVEVRSSFFCNSQKSTHLGFEDPGDSSCRFNSHTMCQLHSGTRKD